MERLVLPAGRHAPLDCQVREELLHLGGAQVAWMALVVEQDEARDPLDVTVLRGHRIVLDAQHLPDLVQQAGRPRQWQFAQAQMQHLAIQKVEGIAAGCQRHNRVFFGLGDGLQKRADFDQAHVTRMALAVEEDEPAAPSS